MFELLLVLIGVLALLMLLSLVRSRRSSGDPSSSVQDFSRALTAMEPGAAGRGDGGPARETGPGRDTTPDGDRAEDDPEERGPSSR